MLGIYFLLPLSGDDEGAGWNRFLHGGFVEDEGDNYDVNYFIGMTTWILFFLDGAIKAEIMSPPCYNFLRSLICFAMVRSGHNEGLWRIIFSSVFLVLW